MLLTATDRCEFICKLDKLEEHFKKCEFGWSVDDYVSNRDLEQQFETVCPNQVCDCRMHSFSTLIFLDLPFPFWNFERV